jgi:hypothetical protein
VDRESRFPVGPTDAGVAQRQLDVAQRTHRRQQVELLEHEADAPVAHLRELHLRHAAHVGAGEVIAARGWHVEAAEDVHQCRLA